MFSFLNEYFPYIIFVMCGMALVSRRSHEQENYPIWLYLFLSIAFIQPWLCLNYFTQTDIWLFSLQALAGIILIIAKRIEMSEENWLKGAVSIIFGFLFLHVSLHPTLGLPFPLSTEWVQCITFGTAMVSLFLIYGLPPLQQGFVDLSSFRHTKFHLHFNVVFRFAFTFFVIAHIQESPWLENIRDLQPYLIACLLFGLGASRLVLRLQTNPFRVLAYLGSSFCLAIVSSLLLLELGPALLAAIAVGFMPFVVLMNVPAPEGEGDGDLWNLENFRAYHPRSAKHFVGWLKIYLGLEIVVSMIFAILLFIEKQWLGVGGAAFAVLSCLAVIMDRKAFVSKST